MVASGDVGGGRALLTYNTDTKKINKNKQNLKRKVFPFREPIGATVPTTTKVQREGDVRAE